MSDRSATTSTMKPTEPVIDWSQCPQLPVLVDRTPLRLVIDAMQFGGCRPMPKISIYAGGVFSFASVVAYKYLSPTSSWQIMFVGTLPDLETVLASIRYVDEFMAKQGAQP